MPDITEGVRKTLTVGTNAFSDGGTIPEKFTGDGEDVSPQLTIRDLPDAARAVAVLVDDPDAPRGTFTHWTLWNLAPRGGRREIVLDEGADVSAMGGVEGTNDFGDVGYGGPKPPSGTHRYRFKAFALEAPLDLRAGAHPHEVERALEGRVLAWGEIVGRYAAKREAEAGERRAAR